MKTKNIIAIAVGISSLATLNLLAGPRVGISVQIPGPPPPVQSPPPGLTAVPTYYVWDGYEYVGILDGQYYYLGPGNVWIPMNQPQWYHFRNWQRYHPDWRQQELRNDRYRDRREWEEHHEWEEHEEHEHHHDFDRPNSERYEHHFDRDDRDHDRH